MRLYMIYDNERQTYISKQSSYGGPTAQPRLYFNEPHAKVAKTQLERRHRYMRGNLVVRQFDVDDNFVEVE